MHMVNDQSDALGSRVIKEQVFAVSLLRIKLSLCESLRDTTREKSKIDRQEKNKAPRLEQIKATLGACCKSEEFSCIV